MRLPDSRGVLLLGQKRRGGVADNHWREGEWRRRVAHRGLERGGTFVHEMRHAAHQGLLLLERLGLDLQGWEEGREWR